MVALILEGQFNYAFWLFVIAGVSDALDGFIARRFNQANTFGLYLDPAADKILVNSAYMIAAYSDMLPWWIAILVLSRDVLIVSCFGLSHLLKFDIQVQPMIVSKTNTGLQIALIGVVLGTPAFGLELADFIEVLVWLTAVSTTLSGTLYFNRWAKGFIKARK